MPSRNMTGVISPDQALCHYSLNWSTFYMIGYREKSAGRFASHRNRCEKLLLLVRVRLFSSS